MLCIVTGFALTAFAAKVAPAPNPSGLVVSNVTSDSITISWTSGGGTTAGFIVAYLEGTTYPAAQCLTGTQVNVGMNTSFVLDNLAADTTVSFRVCAYNSKNQRSTGITVQATTEGGQPPEPGISWQPDAVETSEGGQTDSISVVLNTQPSSNVVILVASSNEAEAIVSTDTLVFTDQNWNQPQTVTVTGVNDEVTDGNASYFIDVVVDLIATEDTNYADLDPFSIPGQNADDDGLLILTSDDTPKAINDYQTTLSQIEAPEIEEGPLGNNVGCFAVDISIDHERMSDLSVTLTSAMGDSRTLTYDGSKWVLPDPTAFDTEYIAGTWTLSVYDNRSRKTGTLLGWSITITPA